jgi:hypothetical protein
MDGMAKDILNPHVVCMTEDMEVRTVAQRLGQEGITGARWWGSSRRATS